MNEFCGSPFWDSNLTWYTDNPQFTHCFEETVLIWLPCGLMWFFTIFEIYFIKTTYYSDIPWNYYNVSKLALNFGLLALTVTDLIVALMKKEVLYPVDYWTPIIKIATFLLIFSFIPLYRKYGIQTSSQFLFWLLMVILCLPRLLLELRENNDRQLFGTIDTWAEYKYDSFLVYFVLCFGMLLLNCFSDANPRAGKYARTKNSSPELSASLLSILVFAWFDKLTWKGHKRPLEQTDLWNLKPQDSCQEIIPLFQRNRYKNKKSNAAKHGSVVVALTRSFGLTFIMGTCLKIIADCLLLVQPLILQWIIGYIESKDPNKSDAQQPQWKGIFYAILLFAIPTLQTLFIAKYFNFSWITGFRIRTALINSIYQKSLVISNAARKESTAGEIVNLMAVDVQRFMELMQYLSMIVSGPLQIILAMYFLWQQLGVSVVVGVAIMIITIPLNGIVANTLKKYNMRSMKLKDNRVKKMNEILNGIKVLKLYAWELSFIKQVDEIRTKELEIQKRSELLMALLTILYISAPVIVSLATFATYVLIDENNVLDATKTFVSLSYFNILRFPLVMLPVVLSNFVQAQVATRRINKFLNNEELDTNSVQHNENDHSLAIVDGSFTWGSDDFKLRNINIQVSKGQLCALVGTVGAGKSSLVEAFLGEMQRLSGRINTVGSIAYVPQQAWMQNASLRDNILFGKPYDRQRYLRVVEACALRADIEMLSAGDKTEIGEKGINLSGGQKQRVSLARAVYNDAEIYLLDDPLSAVDSHVGKHIFEEVIGPNGMLAKKTRVLVTHGITFLPQTDNIYVIKDGEVSENGTYQELLQRKGAFSEFLVQHIQEGVETAEELEEIGDQLGNVELKKVIKRAALARMESLSDSISDQISIKRRRPDRQDSNISDKSIFSKDRETVTGKLIDHEKSETGRVEFTVYKHYLQSISLALAIGCLISLAFYQTFQVSSSFWLTAWSRDERVANETSVRDMYLGTYGALAVGQFVTQFLFYTTLMYGCLRSSKKMHDSLLQGVMRWPMERFDTTPLGRIVNRFSKDINTVDSMLPNTFRFGFIQVFALLATIFVISYSTPLFLFAIIPLGAIYYFIQVYYMSTSRQLSRIESVTCSPIYSQFGETLSGVSTIRAYNAQQRFTDESNKRVELNQRARYLIMISSRWLGVRLETIGNVIILFSALFAVLGGQTNAAVVGLAVTYALQVTETLNFLVRMISDVESNIVAVERIKEYAESKQEAPWTLNDNSKEKSLPSQWPTHGEIQFENLKVRYRQGLDLVLKGITFKVNAGDKVGIVGRTGAGKSSLTLALFRIIEADAGRILIDNVDISQIGLHNLRANLTIIPQDPVLFAGSLRNNLDPFQSKSDAELWHALEMAHLSGFVKSLTAGLNHEVSEGGENLSVGQRQLVCLARALLRKTKVLILDEATAAVDLETDDLIQKTIRSEFKECTVLTIAHRLNTIMDSTKVLVLDKGYVAEYASPKELLQKTNSIFYSMAKDAKLV